MHRKEQKSRGLGLFVALCCCVGWVGAVEAANGMTLLDVEAYATIHHIGVTVRYEGDDNNNGSAAVRYREVNGATWLEGHALLRIQGRRFVGSLFGLKAGAEIEVEVTLTDPDSSVQKRVVRAQMRADAPPAAPANGGHLYVDATKGKANAPGTAAQPLLTIQAAVNLAKAGDTVHVLPGVYRESVTVRAVGTETRPITLMAQGAGVVLAGDDPDIAKSPVWTAVSDGIYSTPFAKTSLYLSAGDVRLYDYDSLADLRAENGRQSGQTGLIKGGFFVDTAAKKLYVRLPDRSDPSKVTIHVAVLDVGIRLDTTAYVVVRGFEIRHYGGAQYGSLGIDVRNSHHCWIQKNNIHHTNGGIWVRKDASASANVIEDNTIRDTSVWGWPWSSVKAHTAEDSAITIGHGRGNIVRRNRLEGHFNGVYVGSFSSQSDESVAKDTDVYDNSLAQHGDDGLEPEGACMNVRFVRNRIDGVYNGLSLAPITVGPLWAIRTGLLGYKAHALKLNNGSTGWMLVYHTTATPAQGVTDAQAIAPSVPFGGFIGRNNIWISNRYVIEYTSTSLKGSVSMDYDLLWTHAAAGQPWFKWLNVRYADLVAFRNGTQMEAHGVDKQPIFEDAKAGDYRPAAGSPMIDTGVFLEGINRQDTAGSAPDIGAWEKGQPLPPREPVGEPRAEPSQEPVGDAGTSDRGGPPQEPIADSAASDSQPPKDQTVAPENPTAKDLGSGDRGAQTESIQDAVNRENQPITDQSSSGGDDGGKTGCQCDSSLFSPSLLWWMMLLGLCFRRRVA